MPVGEGFFQGRTDTPELTWRRADGSIRQIARWQPEWVYPTDEHRNQLARELEGGIQDELGARTEEDRAALLEGMLATWQFDTDKPLPLFTGLMADDEGRVWLREYYPLPGNDHPVLHRLFPRRACGWGASPCRKGSAVFDVNRGRVVGVMKGDMDVESVVVYELVAR